MNFLHRIWSDEKGEDMTEYALIVGLIAIAAVIAMGTLGEGFSNWYAALAAKIAEVAPTAGG